MSKSNNLKYFVTAAVVLASVAFVYAAVGAKKGIAIAGNSTSTNVAVVKKQKLKYPSETAGVLMFDQALCVMGKAALYELKGAQYKPTPDEQLTREQIIALFDHMTVEEYFSGSNYARIESGKKITRFRGVDDKKEKNDPEGFLCKLTLVPYTLIQIKKIDKNITIQATETGNSVDILNISKELQQYRNKTNLTFVPAKTIAVSNTKYKCDLAPIDMQLCYLNGMHTHTGTGENVIVQSSLPEPGSKHDDNKMTGSFHEAYKDYGGSVRGAAQGKIWENISLSVGESISNDKFEIPNFAKNFKTKTE